MSFKLPPLNYSLSSLSPHLTEQVVDIHYNKHTKRYFDTSNELIKGTAFEKYTNLLDAIAQATLYTSTGALLDNLHQAWNHQFYWNNLCPTKDAGEPSQPLLKFINIEFDSFDKFKKEFIEQGCKGVGSHWTWLVLHNNRLYIKNTPNASTPLTHTPLLAIDGWEHAYYLQYPAEKKQYFEAVWNLINWNIVNERFNETQ